MESKEPSNLDDGESRDASLTLATEAKSLWEAAVAWCNPTAVSNLVSAFDAIQRAAGMPTVSGNPFGGEGGGTLALLAAALRWNGMREALAARTVAARAVEVDFLRRFAIGELVIRGVREEPTLDRHQTLISRSWVKGLAIDWSANALRFGKQRFISVTVEPVPLGTKGLARLDEIPRRRGRPKFPLEQLVEIARTRKRLSSNKDEANQLSAEFAKRHSESPPADSTLRRRVNEIYAKVSRKKE